jgi:hypothetical protein
MNRIAQSQSQQAAARTHACCQAAQRTHNFAAARRTAGSDFVTHRFGPNIVTSVALTSFDLPPMLALSSFENLSSAQT